MSPTNLTLLTAVLPGSLLTGGFGAILPWVALVVVLQVVVVLLILAALVVQDVLGRWRSKRAVRRFG